MTLNSYKAHFAKALSQIYPTEEALSILKILSEDLLNWSSTQWLLHQKEDLNSTQISILDKALDQLKLNVPVQHITGNAHFYGRDFKVTPDTLIPRQETEELVHLILNELQRKDVKKIVDIGTGTGCIGLTLSAELQNGINDISTEVELIDVSNNALEVARENTNRLELNQITFTQLDILKADKIASADVFVSNPPYVRELEKVEIHKNVLEHDPALALFVSDEEPLIFYRKIIELTLPHLQIGSLLYFEINQYLSREMAALAEENQLSFELFKDLNGNWRMMKCWIKNEIT